MNKSFFAKVALGLLGITIGMKLGQIGLDLYFKHMPKVLDIVLIWAFVFVMGFLIRQFKKQKEINTTSEAFPFILCGVVLGIVFIVWINLYYGLMS